MPESGGTGYLQDGHFGMPNLVQSSGLVGPRSVRSFDGKCRMRWLTLLVDPAAAEALDAAVVHAVGRLAIVEAASADELTENPAVRAVTDRALPDELADGLTEGEAALAAAFAARTQKPERTGEGLPWDAAGFEPPDAPHDTNAERGDRVAAGREDDDG
jgi:hypothetical protein